MKSETLMIVAVLVGAYLFKQYAEKQKVQAIATATKPTARTAPQAAAW